MENKQTAVEWLKDTLESFGNKHELLMSWGTLDELIEQAKAMEKEQIMAAYSNNGWNDDDPMADAEQYYNETYNKGENKI
jgi:hypothetical protein